MRIKNLFFIFVILVLGLFYSCNPPSASSPNFFDPVKKNTLRAPAYPLITIDPYTSAWSFTDHLYDDVTRHWTGANYPLLGALRVDGVSYRFIGINDLPLETVLPTSAVERWEATYTEKKPDGKWTEVAYDDRTWEKGKAAFGTSGMPDLSTKWDGKDIWVRRTFELNEDYSDKPVILEYSHDDIFELYINGVQVVATDYSWRNHVMLELTGEAKKTLTPGKNIIASHCHNRTGGGYTDFGLYLKDESVNTFETTAIQKSANVLPTQTHYTFACGPVELDVIFTSPLLLDDLDLVSTPVNYISYRIRPVDGNEHDVQIYLEATPEWAINNPGQKTETGLFDNEKFVYAKTGTTEQPILQKKGDNVRIDWGYFYLVAGKKNNAAIRIGEYVDMKEHFIKTGNIALPDMQETKTNSSSVVLAFSEDFGTVSAASEGYVMLGYDDIYSLQYFHENRQGYWKHNGKTDILQAFERADKNYRDVMKRCDIFNTNMMNDAEKAGGKEYAELCALAYRQAISAHKLIEDKDGNLIFLSKENFSNGSIGTVDITYPSSPLFLIYNPDLLKGMMTPIFYFSESGKWNKPFPAHDVGSYPIANGQTYGGDMPVEEAGNMLILTTAIAIVEGNAEYAKRHWPILTTWANYLLEEGLDPENQLCTDDFAGHFAHNANLSIKAIMGIAGYGKIADMIGEKETAAKYINTAKDMARQWIQMADDGEHYRLTFDKPDTWSQKYNLIWDKLFGLNIFPEETAKKEVAYYLTKQNKYGLPLDSRKDYTKTDWIIWSACLANDEEDFRKIMLPVHVYANETVSRIPLSDWHDTKDSRSMNFRARSVVGGYFMKMLENKMRSCTRIPENKKTETNTSTVTDAKRTYRNPVVAYSLPDPSIIKADDGYFYLYATEDIRNTPVHRSKNLVEWEHIGTAFTNETRPTFEPKGGLWAPDINYINGQYVLYYSMSRWGGHWSCGIGAAISDNPEGPFTDKGPLFISKEIDVENSIDQFYIEESGKKYLFWGSFHGIYAIELSDDGLAIKEGAEKKRIAGNAYEGVYIHKNNGFYYMFASIGSCCEGVNSTYTTVTGRSENLFGPYLNKAGKDMLENHHEILIRGNDRFVGTGHNSEIVRDGEGNDWILYHAVDKNNAKGRVLMLDRIHWNDDWPEITGSTPSTEAKVPVFPR